MHLTSRNATSHVHDLDPAASELVPAGLITAKVTGRMPYLYSREQIAELMSRAAVGPAAAAAGVHTLIGLIAATGLRSGEDVALEVDDLSLDDGVLTVAGKYGKQRLVPLHASTWRR